MPKQKKSLAARAMAELRANLLKVGKVRKEMYTHPEDWPAIKAFAAKLAAKREDKK